MNALQQLIESIPSLTASIIQNKEGNTQEKRKELSQSIVSLSILLDTIEELENENES